jgi:hypothetical protein
LHRANRNRELWFTTGSSTQITGSAIPTNTIAILTPSSHTQLPSVRSSPRDFGSLAVKSVSMSMGRRMMLLKPSWTNTAPRTLFAGKDLNRSEGALRVLVMFAAICSTGKERLTAHQASALTERQRQWLWESDRLLSIDGLNT